MDTYMYTIFNYKAPYFEAKKEPRGKEQQKEPEPVSEHQGQQT